MRPDVFRYGKPGDIFSGSPRLPHWDTRGIIPSTSEARVLRGRHLPDLNVVTKKEGQLQRPVAFIFKGQGSQSVGMGKELEGEDVDQVYRVAQEVVGYSVRRLSVEGPEDILNRTVNAQVAILARNEAALRVAKRENPDTFNVDPWCYMGHSLGQYSALIAAGSLTLEDALKLVAVRALGMEYASLKNPGAGNVTVLMRNPSDESQQDAFRKTYDDVVKDCMGTSNLWLGIKNHPTQQVFAGTKDALEKVERRIETGAKDHVRAIRVRISTPAHSPLMDPAKKLMKDFVGSGQVEIRQPKGYVLLNTTARPTKDVKTITQELTDWHLTRTVNWQGGLELLDDVGLEGSYEFGEGRAILSDMVDPILKDKRKAAAVATTALAIGGVAVATFVRWRSTHKA